MTEEQPRRRWIDFDGHPYAIAERATLDHPGRIIAAFSAEKDAKHCLHALLLVTDPHDTGRFMILHRRGARRRRKKPS